MSVASINSHSRHFISKFGINSNEKDGSFCIGFGLERLALAVALSLKNIKEGEQRWALLEKKLFIN